MLKEKEQQEAIHQEMQRKLHDVKTMHVEKKNEGLQTKFDEALHRKIKMLKEKEQQDSIHQQMKSKLQDLEAIHQQIQCKLQVTEKNNGSLCVMFGKVLKRNTEVVKEKEQQEVIHQHMLCRLQTMEALHHQMLYKLHITEKNNEGLHVMFNEALRRNTEMLKDKEQMKQCANKYRANFKTWKQFSKSSRASFKSPKVYT